MGEKRAGVRIRGGAIQIYFRLKGEKKYCYETLNCANTPANVAKAHKLREAIVEKIRHDVFVYADYFPNSPNAAGDESTFFQYAQAWLDNPGNDWKRASRDKFVGILERIWMPSLHGLKIRLVSHSHIAAALSNAVRSFERERGRAPSESLYNDWLLCIRGVFEFAVDQGAIKRLEDPTQELRNKARKKTNIDPFDIEEADAIIALAYDNHGDMWGAWFELGFYTGMRFPGEPSALFWPMIDMRNGEIRVAGTMTKAGAQDSTKTNKSRIVLLNSRAKNAIAKLKPITYHLGREIFVNTQGGNAYGAKFQRTIWRALLAELGIRYRVMYNMRHTYATFGIMSGLKPAFMCAQIGNSLEEFYKTYAKWINGKQNAEEMELMELRLKNKSLSKVSQSIDLNSQVIDFKLK